MAKAQTVAQGEEKIPIGLAEEIILLPWGVKVPARVDTGAAMNSLDARELKIKDGIAGFRLPDKHGGEKMSLPVVGWTTVRSAGGQQQRPVVEIDVCVGPKVVRARVNLIDRSRMTYPFIIGRNILEAGYVVDCLCANILKPACAGVNAR
jgi:hypothetical protein